MSSIVLFLVSFGVFLCLAVLSYVQIKRSYRLVINEWKQRYATCDRQLKAAQQDLQGAKSEAASLKVDAEAERARATQLDSVLKRLYPGPITALDVLRDWKAVDAVTIEKVRKEAALRGEGNTPEEILVKERIVTQAQLDEASDLAAAIINSRSRW